LRDIDHTGLGALDNHLPKVTTIEGNNQTIECLCQFMYRRVFQTGLMKIITNMFDIKPTVQARKETAAEEAYSHREAA
jgi:hypothetical protein